MISQRYYKISEKNSLCCNYLLEFGVVVSDVGIVSFGTNLSLSLLVPRDYVVPEVFYSATHTPKDRTIASLLVKPHDCCLV